LDYLNGEDRFSIEGLGRVFNGRGIFIWVDEKLVEKIWRHYLEEYI
jgi:hypothetical protein